VVLPWQTLIVDFEKNAAYVAPKDEGVNITHFVFSQ